MRGTSISQVVSRSTRRRITCYVWVIFRSDLTIVFHWVKTLSHLLKIYVSYRVAQIQEITDTQIWRYVRIIQSMSRNQLPKLFF